MLLTPNVRVVDSVYDIPEFKFAHRSIIIYENTTSPLQVTYSICVVNNSLQSGGSNKLSRDENLYCSHFYFGEIINPFIFTNTKDRELNENAVIRFYDHGWMNKLVSYISDKEKTVNIWDGTFKQDYNQYKSSPGSQILPSDVRYYNLDHQIIKENSDLPFGTEDRLFGDEARMGNGMFYFLREIIDGNTDIKVSKIVFDNPDHLSVNLLGVPVLGEKTKTPYNPSDLQGWVVGVISRLTDFATRAFITHFTILYDAELGFNLMDVKRGMSMSKKDSWGEDVEFMTQCDNEWTTLCDLGLHVRLTFTYSQFYSIVQLLSLDNEKQKTYLKHSGEATQAIVTDNYLGLVVKD